MITAKIAKVERDRGNLNITVKFYYKGKELEGEDEQYLIPENGLEKERLKEYVQRKIQELKNKLSPKPIKEGEVIYKEGE